MAPRCRYINQILHDLPALYLVAAVIIEYLFESRALPSLAE